MIGLTRGPSDPHELSRINRSERFLAAVRPFSRVVCLSHVNPDPDALASMLGLEALLHWTCPHLAVTLTVDGMIARAENQAMVELLGLRLVPINEVAADPNTAFVMVDSQPRTGRHAGAVGTVVPTAVLDHHETPGTLDGVTFVDLRPNVGATCTIVTGYLLEQHVPVDVRLATALLYGIESETSGYPREATSLDDGALVWLFPRADKDLLARIKNPRLPISYFAIYHHALSNAFLHDSLVFVRCGNVPQPDIVAEVADFFVRFEEVRWAVALGTFDHQIKISARVSQIGDHCGEVLRAVVDGMGTAGGHDKRAGGAVPLSDARPEAVEEVILRLRSRLMDALNIEDRTGRRLLDAAPTIQLP